MMSNNAKALGGYKVQICHRIAILGSRIPGSRLLFQSQNNSYNNNNNNNNLDNIYGSVIMAKPLREFTWFI